MTNTVPTNRVALEEFAVAFVPFGLLLVAALLVPEGTDAVLQHRIAYTIWLATFLLIPGLSFYVHANESQRCLRLSALFVTCAYAAYMVHFYLTTFIVFGGILGIFRNMRLWVAIVNVVVTVWWTIDTALLWWRFRTGQGRILPRTVFYIALFAVFVATDLFLRPTFVRYIGTALAAAVIFSLLVRHGALSRQR